MTHGAASHCSIDLIHEGNLVIVSIVDAIISVRVLINVKIDMLLFMYAPIFSRWFAAEAEIYIEKYMAHKSMKFLVGVVRYLIKVACTTSRTIHAMSK